MAEGWARKLKNCELEAYSAGVETHGLNPHAIKVMAEAGVDIEASARNISMNSLMWILMWWSLYVRMLRTCPYFQGRPGLSTTV